MKLRLATVFVLALMVGAGFAQGQFAVNFFTGYTMTAFEDQDDAAGTLPLGVQLGYMATPQLEIGLEVSDALGGFTFELEDEFGKMESTVNYMVFGLYGRYFLSEANMKPFLKAGVGMFTGNIDVKSESEFGDHDWEVKYKSGIGFTVGGGVLFNNQFFAGFDYNIVSREMDVDDSEIEAMSASSEDEDSEKVGWNTWAVKVGYRVNF